MDAILIDEVNNKINENSNVIINNLPYTIQNYYPNNNIYLTNTITTNQDELIIYNNYYGLGECICDFASRPSSTEVTIYYNDSILYTSTIRNTNAISFYIPMKHICNLRAVTNNNKIFNIPITIKCNTFPYLNNNQHLIYEKDNSNIYLQETSPLFNDQKTFDVIHYGDFHIKISITQLSATGAVSFICGETNQTYIIESAPYDLEFDFCMPKPSIITIKSGCRYTITMYGHPLQIE